MSKLSDAIRLAFKKGYRVTKDGSVINAVGRQRKCQLKRGNSSDPAMSYLVFNIGIGDRKVYPVLVHRLLAYQVFGEDALTEGAQTRHLDGNPLNNTPDNIAMGTPTDNALDRPVIDRKLHAQKAGKAYSKYSDDLWAQVKLDHASGMGYKKLRQKYGIPLGTLSYQISTTAKRNHSAAMAESI